LIHPEPGVPVQLLFVGNVTVSCSLENTYGNSSYCPLGVNFINILTFLLRQYFCAKKFSKPKWNYRKAAQSTFVQKIWA